MIIRKGTKQDIPAITAIYDRILDGEESGRTTIGWIRGIYPTEATAQAALAADELFCMEHEGVVVAAGRINHEQVSVYAQIPWEDAHAPEEQVMVLHTLVVDPAYEGRGFG